MLTTVPVEMWVPVQPPNLGKSVSTPQHEAWGQPTCPLGPSDFSQLPLQSAVSDMAAG